MLKPRTFAMLLLLLALLVVGCSDEDDEDPAGVGPASEMVRVGWTLGSGELTTTEVDTIVFTMTM